MKNNKLFIAIIIALVLGVIFGSIIHYSLPEYVAGFSQNIKLLGTIFIRLVQMIIAPLVFCTLVVGIAKMGDMKMVGRVGGKAMGWFITASLVSLGIGLVLVNWFKPGANANFNLENTSSANDLLTKTNALSLQSFIEHLIPKSIFEAFAHNEILQIVVFAVFFGVALASIGKKGKVIIKLFDRIAEVVLKMVTYIMWTAPLGVLGAIASAVALYGLSIFLTYAKYLLAFVSGLIVLWAVLILVGYLILGKDVWRLLKTIKEPLLIAFSTTSSEAVFPKLVEQLNKFGCSPKIVSFTLPLGYSFNLDGSMMYLTFASIFIAQIYDVPMTIGDQILMLLVLMVTSKGVAGVPRASLIVIVATCAMFNIPPEGIAFILPIDHFCDMGRSMTNVLGNALSTASIDKFENNDTNPTLTEN
ncbi:dicarboxylate/amino acid:cation symporter [Myroides sp. 1354]|uniref:dicarboxylate/amino acid:cation symporter n=1 Tax=unclassified Myroides TaxID=2642485 RepID=UPI002577486E|nr:MULTISPECIES: dicarboxylate/amino acid:cation symporter [unclassified Myroides]MDM1044065.1 dicarboxylate/amino acid:cation symporter [Myroides sp. R163-1]MDM1055000.1 dicarboxylate/amino acid:cation symporter [Myroides sp. 1354]MDM1068297.1 dicarboxylate/amino acid:cation symporter [Myroides sp. 1372]